MIAVPTKVEFPASHPLAGPVERFLTDLANAGRSPHTLRCYRGDLTQFARHHDGGVEAIDASALRGFLSAISEQAKATRARKQATLASFLRWCRTHDLLNTDPMATDDEHLSVVGKGDKQRTILLDDPALLALLRRYLHHSGHQHGPLLRAAKNGTGGPLHYASAEKLWRKYRAAADERITQHQLRHTRNKAGQR